MVSPVAKLILPLEVVDSPVTTLTAPVVAEAELLDLISMFPPAATVPSPETMFNDPPC